MKRSFSLVETLIATVLLSGTITILLESKNFNLNLLNSVKNKTEFDSLISVISVSNISEDKNINFKDLIELNDDDIRKKLKSERITFKKEQTDKIDIDLDQLPLNFDIYSESHKSDKYGTKKYFRVTLNE